MKSPYYEISVSLPSFIVTESGFELNREDFIEDLSSYYREKFNEKFLGVSESIVAETLVLHLEASDAGANLAALGDAQANFFFIDSKSAQDAIVYGQSKNKNLIFTLSEKAHQDWLTKWREGFEGVSIPPYWKIIPAWKPVQVFENEIAIRMNPSFGFGAGTHPTTQLCLEGVAKVKELSGKRVLDFGSGSGILAVGAALRGAIVDAVEIDEMALEAGRECAELNGMSKSVHFSKRLPKDQSYDLILANILSETLIEYAQELVSRLEPSGTLILSGILPEQVGSVRESFEGEVRKRGLKLEVLELERANWKALRLGPNLIK